MEQKEALEQEAKQRKREHGFQSQHMYTLANYLKEEFGGRIAKLSFDAGFTCPNKDGRCGVGGCAFCSDDDAGGYYTGTPEEQKALTRYKWRDAKYLAYFQSNTNTYAPVEVLRQAYDKALQIEGVVGLAIGTRADCLPEDVLSLLKEYHQRTFLWVELGLQSIHPELRKEMNICCSMRQFEAGARSLIDAGIRTVIHIILGLPGETREEMFQTVEYACSLKPFGIKLHMFNLIANSQLGRSYPNGCGLMSREEYVQLVVDLLERIPKEIVMHRLTGDPPEEGLIEPLWVRDKRRVLNEIQKEFKRRGSYQGDRAFGKAF
ncbi:MAG: TIGR01212 family radical SAM protein [Bacillota bacterium]|nr:TIGR01212 family radical SAM protein [Bacillota bacterium]